MEEKAELEEELRYLLRELDEASRNIADLENEISRVRNQILELK